MILPRFLPYFALFLSLALSGCGKSPSNTQIDEVKYGDGSIRWENFPVEIQVESKLMEDSDFAQDLEDAIQFWDSKAGKPLIQLKQTSETLSTNAFVGKIEDPENILFSSIFFYDPWPFEKNVAGNTIIRSSGGKFQAGLILLNSETALCGGDCTELSGLSRRKLLAHELGHFIGLDHSSDKENLMYPEILSGGSLDAVQVDSLTLQKLTL
jgi:hypothetical protein